MAFDLVPAEFERFKPQHVRRVFSASTAATVLITTPGTFTKIVPIFYRYSGSAAATISMFNGSGGGSIWTGNAIAGNNEQWGPIWDIAGTTGGNSIEWTSGVGIGNGYLEVWWLGLPDSSGLTQ